MPQPVTLPETIPHRDFPKRISIDETERAEQFAAFLRARAAEGSAAPGRAGERSHALPPPVRFEWNPGDGASSPPPWARAHEVARGKPFEEPAAEAPVPPPVEGSDGEAPAPSASGEPTPAEAADGSSSSFAAPLGEPEPTFQPNTPRYQDIPDAWKWPIGPYQQAPKEFGGEWWKVNPFTGSEPWKPVAGPQRTQPTEEFLAVFGSRPEARAFDNVTAYRAARGRWDQDLEFFKQSGIPDGYDETQLGLATSVFESWGMGQPAFYEGRYGWAVRFPESSLPTFEANATTALDYSHLIVAGFQIRQLLNGVDPGERHPFVPPTLAAKIEEPA